MKGKVFIVILLVCVVNIAHADRTVWYVHPDSALNTIQAGLDSCADNDIVLVGPGTYYENIIWPNTQGIHLISELGPDMTIIDGGGTGHVMFINTGVDSTTIINGFTIQNGYAGYGGGIWCTANSSPTITGNTITGNTAATAGGGIGCYYYSSPTITGNIIADNISEFRGGGIFCDSDSLGTIDSNTVTGNVATHGGGIYCRNNSSPTITGNTITGNTVDSLGGGIWCVTNSSPTITGNTITDNTAALAGGGIGCYNYSSPTITGNTITGNTAAYWGGGIVSGLESSPTITGNTITGNTADSLGGGIGFRESSPTITHNTIEGNTSHYGGGIGCDSSSLGTIDSCTISNNTGDGVYCGESSKPEIHYCNISSNTGYGVWNRDSSVAVNAEHNWWGDPSGPGGFGPGTGDSVSDYVNYDPWLTDSVEWVGIEEHEPSQSITTFLQINPNPFRDRVNIKFSMEHSAEVIELKIYDATGRLVKDFSRSTPDALRPTAISWDGTDDSNRKLSSGVYFLKLVTGDYSATEKLLLIR